MKTATTAITALTALALFAGISTEAFALPAGNGQIKVQSENDRRSDIADLDRAKRNYEKNLKALQEKYDDMKKKYYNSEGRAAKAERELYQVKAKLKAAEDKLKELKADDISGLENKPKAD